jgi:hypothetical protein
MSNVNCVECGCTVHPDAIKCPNCGNKHLGTMEKVSAKNNGNGVTMGRIGYLIKCETYGKIQITATVATQSLRCPIC